MQISRLFLDGFATAARIYNYCAPHHKDVKNKNRKECYAPMGFVTKDQIARARQVDILDYVLSYEQGNVRRVGSGYRLKDHPSLAITTGKWYWHSWGIGGRTALDYLTDVREYSFVEAVCLLINENPVERFYNSGKSASVKVGIPYAKPPPLRNEHKGINNQRLAVTTKRQPLVLPLHYKDNKRVIAYLQSRGIDLDLIQNCIRNGVLYESAPYHNCIFLGKDENGKTRYAAMRGTSLNFKRDAEGSDKQFNFLLPPLNLNTHEVAAFESPIDCLSHQTLCKKGFIQPFNGWRLSLGGTSVMALTHFVEIHSNVTHCLICTDNDKAGGDAAKLIMKLPGLISERSLPAYGKDWNDTLQALLKAERTQNQTRQSNTLCL